jgi:hypothetical protein
LVIKEVEGPVRLLEHRVGANVWGQRNMKRGTGRRHHTKSGKMEDVRRGAASL